MKDSGGTRKAAVANLVHLRNRTVEQGEPETKQDVPAHTAHLGAHFDADDIDADDLTVRMIRGVARVTWPDGEVYGYYFQGRHIDKNEDTYNPWRVSTGRIASTKRATYRSFRTMAAARDFIGGA